MFEYICYTEPPGDWHCIECGELMHAPFYVFEADVAPMEPPDCEMYCEACATKDGYMNQQEKGGQER